MKISATIILLLHLPLLASAQSPEQKLRFKRAYDVMQKHCFACHGEEKQKGELRMDSLDALLKGGESGEASLVQGHAEQSPLITRMKLPVSDEDVMPPAKKDRPANRDLIALVEWINDGAPWMPEVVGLPPGSTGMSQDEIAAMHKDMGTDINAVSPEDAAFFKKHIEPVFSNHCSGCHGNQKQKAGLRLDNRRAAFAGSDNGPVIVRGKPKQSEVFIRLSHPISHEDVMPPEEKTRVPPASIARIEEWIARGAPWPLPRTKMERGGENHYTKFLDGLSPALRKEVGTLKRQGVFIEPLIWKDDSLRAIFSHSTVELNDALFQRLAGLEERIAWLDLSKREINEAALSFMQRLPQLRVLHLERSQVDDLSLRKLPDFPKLEYINLHSTQVSDAGLAKLRRYRNLRKIYLWNSKVSEAGVDQLKQALPEARVSWKLGE